MGVRIAGNGFQGANVNVFHKGLLSASGLAVLLGPITVFAEDGNSSFRNRVRAAFEQDVPAPKGADMAEEFMKREKEARDPNLDTEIPEVSGRELGPRITVKQIRFHRLEEFPEFGIDRKTVEGMAETLRLKFMKEDQVVAAGYTIDNLKELALLLDGMNARYTPGDLGPRQLQQLVQTIERQNARRGLTYADLEEIAAELTRYYRQQGLFLAQVQIPAQEVKDGIVTLTVQEGILGQVEVHDNEKYSAKRLASAFSGQRGKLVNHDSIEETLYLLNDYPSLNITGYFSPGDNPGETRLNLKVRDESSWNLVTRMDNHGSLFTGDDRIFTSLNWLNPLGFGDALRIGYLKSSGNDRWDSEFGSDLGQLEYSIPVFGPRTRIQISADYNEFTVHDAENPANLINLLDIQGVNESYALSVEHKLKRSRDFNITASMSATDKKTEINARIELPEDHVIGGEVGVYMDSLSAGSVPMLNMVNAKIQYGEFQSVVEPERGNTFEKFAADTSSLLFLPMPFSEGKTRLLLKSRWQYSENALPSFEQFSLGGANGVRAFDVRDFSADQAAMLIAEWYLPFPEALNPRVFDNQLNDIVQVAVIADAGYGVVNSFEADAGNDWAALSGAGLLFKFSWDESWASQVSVAWPTMSKSSVSGTGGDADTPTVYADFSYFLK